MAVAKTSDTLGSLERTVSSPPPGTELQTLGNGCGQNFGHAGVAGANSQLHGHACGIQGQLGSNERVVATPVDPGQVERVRAFPFRNFVGAFARLQPQVLDNVLDRLCYKRENKMLGYVLCYQVNNDNNNDNEEL